MWPFLRREEIKVLGTVLKRLAQGIFGSDSNSRTAAGDQRQYGTGKVHPGAV